MYNERGKSMEIIYWKMKTVQLQEMLFAAGKKIQIAVNEYQEDKKL